MKIFKYLPVVIFLSFYSCTPTNSVVKDYTSPDFNKEVIRTVTVLNMLGGELSENEIMNVKERLFADLESRFKQIAFYKPDKFINDSNRERFQNIRGPFWKKYLNSKKVDPVALYDMAEIIKSNAVMQIAITDVEKIYGEHRKTVGQTTVELEFALFSLKSGQLLWRATVSGTQANAHSDQVIPKVIEAVNVAQNNIVDKMPFH